MCIKTLSVWSMALLLVACGGHTTLRGLPTLSDGTQTRWVYFCAKEDKHLTVEYANRGGRYSATLELEEGKRVLDIVQQEGQIVATLEPLVWSSTDRVQFRLQRGEEIVFDHCRAVREEQLGNIRIKFGS